MQEKPYRVSLRFYEELNDYLPRARCKITYQTTVPGDATVGDLIQTEGVPLAEVDLVLVNGESVDFARPVEAGDRIAVFPVFESFDISPLARVPGRPLRRLRFAVDEQLAELAQALIRQGFDVILSKDDDALLRVAREGRVVLTDDPALLQSQEMTRIYLVRATTPQEQLPEVLRRFDFGGTEPSAR